MSINIGDNFKYLGKKFLDDRESFATIEDMKNCENVPDGFITYCREDEKRYEFKSSNTISELTGKWTEFTININNNNNNNNDNNNDNNNNNNEEDKEDNTGGGCDCEGTTTIIECNCSYMGIDEPEDTNQIWFFESTEYESSGIQYDNPLISELFSYIQSLQNQIIQLQADVEYLKLNGGGGMPSEPEGGGGSITQESYFELEAGGYFEFEDGSGFMILEQSSHAPSTVNDSLLLEDGSSMLLEDGNVILLEMA